MSAYIVREYDPAPVVHHTTTVTRPMYGDVEPYTYPREPTHVVTTTTSSQQVHHPLPPLAPTSVNPITSHAFPQTYTTVIPATIVHTKPLPTEHIVFMDRFTFVTLILACVIMTLLFISTVGLGWAKASTGVTISAPSTPSSTASSATATPSTSTTSITFSSGIFKQCICSWTSDTGCDDMKTRFATAKAFSLLSLIFEAFIIVCLFYEATYQGKFVYMYQVFLGLGIITCLWLMISWAVFSGLYDGSFCSLQPMKKSVDLDFCFGLRVVEFALMFIVCVIWVLQIFGKILKTQGALRGVATTVIVIGGFSLISTISRGWASGNRIDWGIWEVCTCTSVDDFPCTDVKNLFRAVEAFALMSIMTLSVIMIIQMNLLNCTPHWLVMPILTWFNNICIMIAWAIYAGWFNNKFCSANVAFKDIGDLDWCFALFIVAWVLDIALSVFLTMHYSSIRIPFLHAPAAPTRVVLG